MCKAQQKVLSLSGGTVLSFPSQSLKIQKHESCISGFLNRDPAVDLVTGLTFNTCPLHDFT